MFVCVSMLSGRHWTNYAPDSCIQYGAAEKSHVCVYPSHVCVSARARTCPVSSPFPTPTQQSTRLFMICSFVILISERISAERVNAFHHYSRCAFHVHFFSKWAFSERYIDVHRFPRSWASFHSLDIWTDVNTILPSRPLTFLFVFLCPSFRLLSPSWFSLVDNSNVTYG